MEWKKRNYFFKNSVRKTLFIYILVTSINNIVYNTNQNTTTDSHEEFFFNVNNYYFIEKSLFAEQIQSNQEKN
jgi:hypothetical protein